jgi:hypothetical protein
VNNASGAKTQLAGIITAVIVMFVLLFLTPMFALVPYNAIGAIIIAGCTTLFEYKVAAQLWRVSGVPCCAVPCRAVPCCAVPCRAVLCRAVLCCAVLCCAVPCRAVPCRAVPCRAPEINSN